MDCVVVYYIVTAFVDHQSLVGIGIDQVVPDILPVCVAVEVNPDRIRIDDIVAGV